MIHGREAQGADAGLTQIAAIGAAGEDLWSDIEASVKVGALLSYVQFIHPTRNSHLQRIRGRLEGQPEGIAVVCGSGRHIGMLLVKFQLDAAACLLHPAV